MQKYLIILYAYIYVQFVLHIIIVLYQMYFDCSTSDISFRMKI